MRKVDVQISVASQLVVVCQPYFVSMLCLILNIYFSLFAVVKRIRIYPLRKFTKMNDTFIHSFR